MKTFEDVQEVRATVLAEVLEQVRNDAAKQPTMEATKTLCNDRIIKAFVKARLFPKGPNSSHRRIADNCAAQMAERLFVR